MNAINTTSLASPIAALGIQMQAVGQEMLRLENISLSQSDIYRQLDDLHDGLIYKAMASEPVTLRDAVVLALCVADQAGFLDDCELQPEDAAPFHRRIVKANASILLALMKAGVRTDDIGPHNAEYEVSRHRHEPGSRAGIFAAEPRAVSPDARLLDITEEFFCIKAESDEKYEAVQSGTEEEKTAFGEWDQKRDQRMDEISTEATTIVPTTPEGFAAKARLAEYELLFWHGTGGEPNGGVFLAAQICRELQARVAV
ncbi:hypothetical protein [Acidisoma silvae]|uniref:Uncharacterized protein n=1 Tax=Acidisoma silvae TaxID=2802396 RepID=A0A963YWH3_9PROT|nr:hypothetical protein [Acidisoma silvae]MCB8878261.1 hypothetical protein [Acidisoma silvae]